MKFVRIALLGAAIPLLFNLGCSSSDNNTNNSNSGPVGGAVAGAADAHCGATVVTVDPTTCSGDNGAGGAADEGDNSAAGDSAGGAADCNQTHDAEYGDTLYGTSGDDDDCKYAATWSSTPIRLNQNVTFTLSASSLKSMLPLEPLADGIIPLSRLDVYQPCQPTRRGPAQNAKPTITQLDDGTFSVGPIQFDQPGRWVVRFHLYEQCIDGDVSPHGHIAFFIDVPASQ